MEQIDKQILDMQPFHKLSFKGYYNHFAHACIRLMNPSEYRKVGFEIIASSPESYCVDKSRGVINPDRSEYINIIMLMLDDKSLEEYEKHEFVVESYFLPNTENNDKKEVFKASFQVQVPEIKLDKSFSEWRLVEAAQANVIMGTELVNLRKENHKLSKGKCSTKKKLLDVITKQAEKYNNLKEQTKHNTKNLQDENKELITKIDKLNQENTTYIEEINNLRNELARQQEEQIKKYSNLKEQSMYNITNLQIKNTELTMKLDKLDQENVSNIEEISKLRAEIAHKQEVIKKFHNSFTKVFKEPMGEILFPSILALGLIFAGIGAAHFV